MGDYYGSGRKGKGRETEHEDFEEVDVWDVINYNSDFNSSSSSSYTNTTTTTSSSSSSSSSSARHFSEATSTPRIAIAPPPPQARTRGGGEGKKMAQRSSAPVNIPNWSKIYGGADVGPIAPDHGCGGGEVEGHEEEEEEMVPPHEWLARKLAGSQISSFSVCEGIGRTLKGRDLSQVRNAILTKTGFLE